MYQYEKDYCIIGLLLLGMALTACSFPQSIPEEGIWYCEELMIETDFSELNANATPNCANRFNEDGTRQDVLCYIDYGDGIWVCSEDCTENYLLGAFLYQNGAFSVTTREDECTYIFTRVDDSQQNINP